MNITQAKIRTAFRVALESFYPERRPFRVSITVEETDIFLSTCEVKEKYYRMRISTAVLEQLETVLCEQMEYLSSFTPPSLESAAPLDASETSLVWLALHELHHIHLNHFDIAKDFGVVMRTSSAPQLNVNVPTALRPLTPLCLEMQADHEATEMLLKSYSADGWHELRGKVLAISCMMMLIEREDTKNRAKGRTHPKAATRIFQLLGHLSEMPLIKAQLNRDPSLIPRKNELQTFARDVTIPCFFDAIQLARVVGAQSIANDLGSPEAFFKDLEIAKLSDPSRHIELKTQGAQEWAKLWPCNKALKPILGGHFMT